MTVRNQKIFVRANGTGRINGLPFVYDLVAPGKAQVRWMKYHKHARLLFNNENGERKKVADAIREAWPDTFKKATFTFTQI